jgi:hypothetical protein
MAKRGKILRDANAGPGLLMVEGQQYQFSLEGVWRSEQAPRPGLTVDVDFDPSGQIVAITAVPESQLAKEQAEVALRGAKDQGKKMFDKAVAAVGLPNLVAGVLLLISWTYLTAASMQLPIGGKIEFTFWQILGFLNSSNVLEMMERAGRGAGAGIYGFLAIVCLAGPFVWVFWKDKRAHLAGAAPLVFMVIVGIMLRSSLSSAMGGGVAAGPYADIQKQATDEMMKAFSYGLGTYLSILISLYFAGIGAKNFLAAKASDVETYQKAPKLAA